MNDSDLEILFGQIDERWQNFHRPTLGGLRDWHEALADMSYETALWAVKDQFKNIPYPPKLADIIKRAGNCPYHGPEMQEQAHHGYPGIWIECVEAPRDKPGRLGWRKPLAYNAYKPLPPRANMEAWATEWAGKNAELYGGRWIMGYDDSNPYQERTAT